MIEFTYDLSTILHPFSKELILPENMEAVLKITGDLSHDIEYSITATLAKNASLTIEDTIHTTAQCTARLMVRLEGTGASLWDMSRYYGRGNAALNIERTVVHTGAETVSHLEARGVVDESARTVWRGRICVQKSAEKARAFQKHDALLASARAAVDASPVLEIYTNDVACNHSASVQRITSDQIFYCGSRGVSEQESRAILVNGFLV